MNPAPIGITLGDPTGIGPELIVRLAAQAAPDAVVYGDAGVLLRTAASLGLPPPALRLREVSALSPHQSQPGRPNAAAGAAQVAYIEAALADAQAGRLSGLCTAPIHKASAMAGGLRFPGHTELLAERLHAGPGPVVMMLAGPSLRVALCTTHLALAAVPAALTVAGVRGVLQTTALALHRDFAIPSPRLWVAGLNPHAGEDGHFGREELDIIAPAIAAARALPELGAITGLRIEGPAAPDAVFRAAVHPPAGARPDAVVAMYHDQGLIPLKLLDFDEGVNVTLGLRVPRTSPDHGVAHDIAGRGVARLTSMAAALRLCQDLAARRRGRVSPPRTA